MELRPLGNSDIKVSLICLGTMTWGEQNTARQAFEQLDYALGHGVNFIDTAEMYPVPPQAQTYSETEKIIGQWLSTRANRDQFILASKVAGPADWLTYIRDGNIRLDRNNILAAVEASLTRLNTDHIDLYQLHWPDRNTNYFGHLGYEYQEDEIATPIIETLEVMNELIVSGKIRHYGLSNETPWGTMSFIKLAELHGYPKPVSIQNPYNLLNRTYEIGLSEISHRENIGLMAYSPLGFGVLSGKYLNGQKPDGARLSLFERFTRYSNPQALSATQQYVEIAHRHNLDPAQMALAYVNTRPFLTSNIVGATTMDQLIANINSIQITLSDEVLAEIESVHTAIPNPSP